MALELAQETVWFDKWKCDDAEKHFYENKSRDMSRQSPPTDQLLTKLNSLTVTNGKKDPPLLSFDETILKLSKLPRKSDNNIDNKENDIDNKDRFYDPPATLISTLDAMRKRAESTLKATEVLHDFVVSKQKDKKLKMANQSVPEFILPNGFDASIHDVKIDGRGPDDKVYNKHPDIRKWIMRGNTLVKLHHNNIEQYYDTIIYGHKKFTGGMGDEDETQPENNDSWRDYCLGDPETADKVVVMDKLNGEAAHFSGRNYRNLLSQ